jgi:sodium-dependent dicarboxylate transporter 2/3/5
MTTKHFEATDFVIGRMSPAERKHAETHLADCTQCQAAVSAVRQDQERATEPLIAFADFAFRLLLGSVSMVGPFLRQVPFESTSAPDESSKLPKFEPLRVLQPRVARKAGQLIGRFGLVLFLTVTVLILPTPTGLSIEGHRALAVFVFTGSILALEPVSLPIAALLIPVVQIALGLADATQAFSTFSRPVVFLILASLFLAEGLRKHGLTRRLALSTIVATGGGIGMLSLGLMGLAALFSMWVENTATAAVLIPVALTISKQIPDPKKARSLLVLLVLGIAYGASLGGMVTIMGSASNAVASGFLAQVQPWTFFDWMKYGLPAFILVFPLSWWLLSRLVRVPVQKLDVEPVRERVAKLGPMNRYERELLFTLGGAVVLWVGGSFIEGALGLPSTLLSAATVAVVAVVYLALRNIINWEDVKGVSWGIFLIIGAGLSLGEVLSRSGATDWLAGLFTPLVTRPPLLVSLLLMVTLTAFLTDLMNNTTIAAVFVPILITLAANNPTLNAVQLVLPVTMATTFGYSLPSSSGRMALIAASGLVTRTEMLRTGVIVTLGSSAVLGLFFYVLTLLDLI